MPTNPDHPLGKSRQTDPSTDGSLEWFGATLAGLGDAVILIDPDGVVTSLNSVAEALTGWTRAQARGVPLEEVLRIEHEDGPANVESLIIRALRGDVPVPLLDSTLVVAKDGSRRRIDERTATIGNPDGDVAGSVKVFRDVTDRERDGRVMRGAIAYARDVIATLREPFLVLDGDLKVMTANSSFYESFRASREEMEGQSLYELDGGRWEIPGLRRLMDEVKDTRRVARDYEIEHDFPDLGRRSLILNVQPFPRDGPHPELILLAIEDTTEVNRAESASRKSDLRYRRLFETAQDGILILDAVGGKILDANPFMTQILGLGHDQFVGKELWEIGLFEDKAANQDAFTHLQSAGYIRYEHLPLATGSGQQVEVEFVGNFYQEGQDSVIQCNIRDITDRRVLERRTEDQLVALAEAGRRKDEFLAILSHELRNPLAAILNAVQIFHLKREENPAQRKAKSIIERQVGQLIHLVDDLLEVSRITTGKVSLRLERSEFCGILKDAIDTVRPEIGKFNHQISVSTAEGQLWLLADPARLEQIIVNLITNAAKYTDPGGQIGVTLDREGGQAVLRVRDTGIGIAPTLLPRIFELFIQADRSLERSQGGLGIGLALVHQLVSMHGGTVEAHSEGLGRGSEFVVRLPMDESSIPGTLPEARTSQLRVLLVDDNVDYAESIATLLQSIDYEVEVAHNGSDALDVIATFHPDVVVLDIGLPEMDGYEVARRIRLDPACKGLRLVGVSGYRQETGSPQPEGTSFDSFLLKPVLLEVLEASLRP